MKLLKYLIVLLLFTLSYDKSFSQCDEEKLFQKCLSSLDDFTFLKVYYLVSDKGDFSFNKRYSYVFSKGNRYMLTYCTDEYNKAKLAISIYDNSGKMLISSYAKITKKYYKGFVFDCHRTGVYYFNFFSQIGENVCNASMLSLYVKKE